MAQTDQFTEAAAASDSDSNTSLETDALQLTPQAGLRTLAPELKVEEHAVYVNHLEESLTDPRNKNIALTGPYGSGKSSVLDQFLKKVGKPQGQEPDSRRKPQARGADYPEKRKSLQRSGPQRQAPQHETLRISISTLGPDEGDSDITNRIQKELVKQLLYRAEPGMVRRSRFARSAQPTWKLLVLEPLGVAVGLVCVLWLFGIRPDVTMSESDSIVGAVVSVVSLLVVIGGATWALRAYLGDRLISQFSWGGTTISFDEGTDSYFDEYLDEIVEFFDATGTDLVVFEDLDRFEDPRIFESLRELNTLINASAKWKVRDQPLRFVYAIKDSVFEKLGEELAGHGDGETTPAQPWTSDEGSTESRAPSPTRDRVKRPDAAQAAVERANRTKFFELVIPVVPFLSHSNARDLLSQTLEALELPKGQNISRKLIDLVARHTTDMRLMINIRNEFVVFAEKLLWVQDPAPGLTLDDLFALVAFKNFHPGDFEALPHRGSALDTLERKRRDVVHQSISDLQQKKSNLLDRDLVHSKREATAQELGQRLVLWAKCMGQEISQINVENKSYSMEDARTPKFWRHVSNAGRMRLNLRWPRPNNGQDPVLGRDHLSIFLPDSLNTNQWDGRVNDVDGERIAIDEEIADLLGADFEFLVEEEAYASGGTSFASCLDDTLDSELARDLVRGGFLNRYFAEYSSVFYGNFVGVEVANFFRNCIWPNEMDIYFQFPSSKALGNLMDEAPEDFTSSRSVLNIDVVNYLLQHAPSKAERVATFLVSDTMTDGMMFLDAFLKYKHSRKTALIRHLAEQPWRSLFNHLAHPDAFTDEETRTELLDTALLAAQSVDAYDLGKAVGDLLAVHHGGLSSFTQEQNEDQTAVIYSFALNVGLIVPSLRPLSPQMLERFIDDAAYDLTADNIRCALRLQADAPIALDSIRGDDRVWRQCRVGIDDYLDAVEEDEYTAHAVLSADVLIAVIRDQRESWEDDQLAKLLKLSAPNAEIADITDVDEEVRPALVRGRLMAPTAQNMLVCAGETGIDGDLAGFLKDADQLRGESELEDDDKNQLALHLLNSRSLTPSTAVDFVKQLGLSEIEVSGLDPREGLLVPLLQAHLVPDERATFDHFIRRSGWPGVEGAFEVSQNASEFLAPDLVSGIVADLLEGPTALDALKRVVLDQLANFIPDEEDRALRAAGTFARSAKFELPLPQIERIADAAPEPRDVEWQLDKKKSSLSGDDILRVLAKLGDAYTGFGEAAGYEFSVPRSSEMHRLLVRLEKDGRVESGRADNGRRPVRILGP